MCGTFGISSIAPSIFPIFSYELQVLGVALYTSLSLVFLSMAFGFIG
jgi:hypothetical protein